MISMITEQIYIGDQQDALNVEMLKRMKFDSVINLNHRCHLEEKQLMEENKIDYCYFDCDCSKEYFYEEMQQALLKFIAEIRNDKKVLIHCEIGMERSPLIVAKYLSYIRNIPLNKAYNIVKYFRPQTIEHYEWDF